MCATALPPAETGFGACDGRDPGSVRPPRTAHDKYDFPCLPLKTNTKNSTQCQDTASLHIALWNHHCSHEKRSVPLSGVTVFAHQSLRHKKETRSTCQHLPRTFLSSDPPPHASHHHVTLGLHSSTCSTTAQTAD